MKRFKPLLSAATLALTSSVALAQTPSPPTTETSRIPAATEPAPAATAQPAAEAPDVTATGASTTEPGPPAATAPSMSPAAGDASSEAMKDAAKAEPTVTQSPGDTATSKLMGASVYNTQNEHIGEIQDLLISSSGSVSTVVIGVGGFLGIGEKKVAMPFTALKQEKGDNNLIKIVVEGTRESLKAQPHFIYAANNS